MSQLRNSVAQFGRGVDALHPCCRLQANRVVVEGSDRERTLRDRVRAWLQRVRGIRTPRRTIVEQCRVCHRRHYRMFAEDGVTLEPGRLRVG